MNKIKTQIFWPQAVNNTPQQWIQQFIPKLATEWRLMANRLNSVSTTETMPGTIIGWSGMLADCPTGWAVCDGTNGTPDLTASFIT